MTVAYAGERRRSLEQRIGRELTAAETHIRVEEIDTTLNRAKDLLDAEIRAEQGRLANAIADGHGGQLTPTPRMLAILTGLRAHGAAHALAELHSMGYPTRPPARRNEQPSDDEIAGRLRARLGQLTIKVQQQAVGTDLSELSQDAIARALTDVLGARSIAADLVAPAFDAGLADTFEQHQDLVDAWQYTAVNDAGLCEECAPYDGEIYDTLDALFEVLPDFGPNPSCEGGDRCRCRAVPVPPDPDTLAEQTVAPSGNVDWTTSTAFVVQDARATLTALGRVHELPVAVPTVAIRVADLPSSIGGRYTTIEGGGPTIELNRRNDQAGMTTLHEFGHYISDAVIGKGDLSAATAADLAEWRDAILESDAVARFVALARGDVEIIVETPNGPRVFPVDPDLIFGYYLHPEELFARSYSQWAALRTGDPQLLRELELARRRPYPEQWQNDDFAAIAAAFDRLMEKNGWTTGPT